MLEIKLIGKNGRWVAQTKHGHETSFPKGMTELEVKMKLRETAGRCDAQLRFVDSFEPNIREMFKNREVVGCAKKMQGLRVKI